MAVDSIWTASRRILWICLSIISSAALAGSRERMNRFIFGGMDVFLSTELMSSGYCFYVVGVIFVSIFRSRILDRVNVVVGCEININKT